MRGRGRRAALNEILPITVGKTCYIAGGGQRPDIILIKPDYAIFLDHDVSGCKKGLSRLRRLRPDRQGRQGARNRRMKRLY
jgi:hypothetical protein